MAERYQEIVPAPDVVVLDGIGHSPQVEDPDAVWRAFAAFAASLPA
jgi:pimeloyl-ACP methyl ester carboxylesterase